jgi:signal transduction histidine kinase
MPDRTRQLILMRLSRLFFPSRASTQAWMMLTFALFVGIAVAGTGLYAFFGLRGEIRAGAEQALMDRAARAADQIAAVRTVAEQRQVAQSVARLSGAEVAVLDVGTGELRWNNSAASGPDVADRPEVADALALGSGFAAREVEGEDHPTLYAALYRPDAAAGSVVVRMGEPAGPAYGLVRKALVTLAVGMTLALAFALIAAWIASEKVVGPLRSISETARRMNAGDLDGEITVRTRATEIQDLARSLNQMATRFRADIGELQRMQQVQNEFIGNVSHEVKNPIFAVSGYLEALGGDTLSPELRQRYAAKGLHNLQRLNNLFSDLIEIARLEYREDLIRPSRFDLQELLEEVAETIQPKAEKKGIELIVENPPLDVLGDRARIRQVLTNLIDNSVAYSQSPTVRCRFRRRLGKARVEVVDTGKGIPQEHLDRIFERFYRVDTARSRKEGGTGLGLSIVKQILQAHGEAIHAESTVGRGTRFWFELPLADGEAAEESAPETSIIGAA